MNDKIIVLFSLIVIVIVVVLIFVCLYLDNKNKKKHPEKYEELARQEAERKERLKKKRKAFHKPIDTVLTVSLCLAALFLGILFVYLQISTHPDDSFAYYFNFGTLIINLIPAFIAKYKNRNYILYYLLSFFISSLLTTIIIILLPTVDKYRNTRQ